MIWNCFDSLIPTSGYSPNDKRTERGARTFESEGRATSRFHRPENSTESLPTMNINSLSNSLSWTAPVPHFLFLFVSSCCCVFFFGVFSLSEEVFLHVTQLFTNLVWCSNAHTAVASFSCDILPQLALLLVGHLAV